MQSVSGMDALYESMEVLFSATQTFTEPEYHLKQFVPISNANCELSTAEWSYHHNEDELSIYNEILNENQCASEWEDCTSEEDDEVDTLPPVCEDPAKLTVNFCHKLVFNLPQFCDVEEMDENIANEIEATEKETVHMDLLTCTAATTNCYRENNKPVIKSKYGKWSCNGRSDPLIGLGPLEQLFSVNEPHNNNYSYEGYNEVYATPQESLPQHPPPVQTQQPQSYFVREQYQEIQQPFPSNQCKYQYEPHVSYDSGYTEYDYYNIHNKQPFMQEQYARPSWYNCASNNTFDMNVYNPNPISEMYNLS